MKWKLILISGLFLSSLSSFGQKVDTQLIEYYESFYERSISIGIDPLLFSENLGAMVISDEVPSDSWAQTWQDHTGRAVILISSTAQPEQLEVLVYHELVHFLLHSKHHYPNGPLLTQGGGPRIFELYKTAPDFYKAELFDWLSWKL